MTNKYDNTKWDVSKLTGDQKRQWQEKMFKEGCTWAKDAIVRYLDSNYYIIGKSGFLNHGNSKVHFEDLPHKERSPI